MGSFSIVPIGTYANSANLHEPRDTTLVPTIVPSTVHALEEAITALPEPSRQDAARAYLTVGEERLEGFQEALRLLKDAREGMRLLRLHLKRRAGNRQRS